MNALTLRHAVEADRDRILAWANDPETRRMSFSTRPITPDEHAAWFAAKLREPTCLYFIVLDGDVPIGQVRFDGREPATVSMLIAPEHRRRGYAAPAIRAATQAATRAGRVEVHAHVKADNEASLRAFERAGYVRDGRAEGVVRFVWIAGRGM